MKPLFTAEDFTDPQNQMSPHSIARVANEKLQKLIDSCPTVYGSDNKPNEGAQFERSLGDTYKAKLMFIENLLVEPCQHKPAEKLRVGDGIHEAGVTKCEICGVQMKATGWEVVNESSK